MFSLGLVFQENNLSLQIQRYFNLCNLDSPGCLTRNACDDTDSCTGFMRYTGTAGKHRQASASIGKHHYSTIIQHIQPRCDSETFLNQKTSQKAVGSVLPLDVAGGLEMPTIIPKVTTINTASTGVVGHNFACPCRTRSDQDHLQSLKCEQFNHFWLFWVIFGSWFTFPLVKPYLVTVSCRGQTSVRTECGMDQLRKVGVLGGLLGCKL